jgi:hypothetical protein
MQQSTPLPTIGMPRVRPILAGCATIVVFVFIFVNLGTSEYPSFRPVKADSCSVPATPPSPPTLKDQNAGHSYSVTTQKYPVHPIPILMAAGELKWQSMLRGQSRTLRAAVKEYKARYGMNPPDGFDLWFQYAKEQNVVLIDEFDEMMTAMEPLRELGKEELRRRSDALLKFGIDYSLGGVIIGGQTTFTHVPEPAKDTPSDPSIMEHPGGYRTAGFLEMLAPVKEILSSKAASWPVFSVPVNELAEARVVAGDEYWPEAAVMNISSSYTHNDLFHEHQHGARTLSEDLARACGPESNLAKKAAGTRFEFGIEEVIEPKHGLLGGEGRKPEFVIDPNSDNDMCERPELMTVRAPPGASSAPTFLALTTNDRFTESSEVHHQLPRDSFQFFPTDAQVHSPIFLSLLDTNGMPMEAINTTPTMKSFGKIKPTLFTGAENQAVVDTVILLTEVYVINPPYRVRRMFC